MAARLFSYEKDMDIPSFSDHCCSRDIRSGLAGRGFYPQF